MQLSLKILPCVAALLCAAACSNCGNAPENKFASDEAFLKQHSDAVVLRLGKAAAIVVPAWQGRIMTLTDNVDTGESFGWINRPAISEGVLSPERAKGTLKEHIHAFGGEERFWLAPEGGQFSFYFGPGAKFEFSEWKVPAALDTEPFKLTSLGGDYAEFSKSMEIANYSGTRFWMQCDRKVRLLDSASLKSAMNLKFDESKVSMVAAETQNRVKNAGKNAWVPESGLPAIWLLGMFNVSDSAVIAVPLKAATGGKSRRVIDDYFGKISPDRFKIAGNVAFLKADGKSRGKIGVPPGSSKGIAAAYDPETKTLTFVASFPSPDASARYVNNLWSIQKDPYSGDAVSAYNDGPVDGTQMGPFFELETTSPAMALKPGQTFSHNQITAHFRGDAAELNRICNALLGVDLEFLSGVFKACDPAKK